MSSLRLPVRRNGPGDPTPRTMTVFEDRGPVVLWFDCVQLHGIPQCYGAAGMGPEHCTCDPLSALDHAWCEREAHRQLQARDYQLCEDCAFRKGSPESEAGELPDLVASEAPFLCHRGMPAEIRGGELRRYVPRDAAIHRLPRAYPVCMGWLRARRAGVREKGS